MTDRDVEMIRTLLQSLMHTAAALDQIINPVEPERQIGSEERRPRLAYLGEEEKEPA